jgi:hypothetical protein
LTSFDELSQLIDDDPDEASRRAALSLDKNPDDALALFVIAEVYSRAERFGVAVNLYTRITQLKPERPEPWNNLGMCYAGLGNNGKARGAFFEAHNRNKRSPLFSANVGMTYFADRDFKKAAEWCNKSLAIEPNGKSATNTLGMCNLSLGNWSEGWKQYSSSVGGKFRKQIQYADEGMWDGSPGQTVVFYGEQGLGDEIMYASCLPDMEKACGRVIVDCDKRLEGLFRRSFPGIEVHGTRRDEAVPWLEGVQVDASLPVGQMPQFCRPSPKDCPGTPYLIADPERRTQWRALFDSFGPKPKIGICWSGGSKHNKPKERAIGLEAMRGLIESIDADWISLQYKDPTAEIKEFGLPIRHYKRACETDDYDDTAAMVAELDMVIGVHTTAHHLAGALGVPGIILVPSRTIWIYCLPDGSMPWYRSASLFKQREGESWKSTIERLINDPLVCGFRPEGSRGVSRLLPVSDQPLVKSCGVSPAGAVAVA